MTIAARNGWGWISNLVTVAKTVAGVNVVQTNAGVGAAIQTTGRIRLTKLCYRVDLAPDVAAGSVSSPTQYRLVVLSGANIPPDVGAWQQSGFGNASAHPEIPGASPLEVLFDLWLEFAANDPGLNQLATIDFADAGPSVAGGQQMIAFLVPMNTTMTQAVVPADGTVSNAQLTLGIYGRGDDGNIEGGNAGQFSGASLPRYDVRVGTGG
jgi:hypothetical protein